MGFNWVDLVIVLLLLVFIYDGFDRSLLSELLDFASFLLAFFLSFIYYQIPGNFFETQLKVPHGFSLALGFMTIWFVSEIAFFATVKTLIVKLHIKLNKYFPGEKILAVIPAFLRGLIFIALFLVLIATFPINPGIKKDVLNSKLGSLILKNAYQFEQPVKQVFGAVSQDSLTFLTIKPKTDEEVDLGFKIDDFTTDEKSEMDMIDLVNQERTKRGFGKLEFDSDLRIVARMHSEDMFRRGYFAHYSKEGKSVADRADQVGIDYLVIGENLAYAPSLLLAHQGLMNSPGHKANILSPDYSKIGIGVMDGGVYGKMFVQVFSN